MPVSNGCTTKWNTRDHLFARSKVVPNNENTVMIWASMPTQALQPAASQPKYGRTSALVASVKAAVTKAMIALARYCRQSSSDSMSSPKDWRRRSISAC